MPKQNKAGFYAVAVGRQVGVYETWEDCNKQVNGFPFCKFKKFKTEAEAWKFVEDNKVEAIEGASSSTVTVTVKVNLRK